MAPASGLKASSLSSWHCCTSRNPPLPKAQIFCKGSSAGLNL
eukprot:CCRYP_012492-RC/>CCRYP_012492-RC protein AED:0.34 eAED:1.00 QI:0/-1/0/1/-1/0/1/0/41